MVRPLFPCPHGAARPPPPRPLSTSPPPRLPPPPARRPLLHPSAPSPPRLHGSHLSISSAAVGDLSVRISRKSTPLRRRPARVRELRRLVASRRVVEGRVVGYGYGRAAPVPEPGGCHLEVFPCEPQPRPAPPLLSCAASKPPRGPLPLLLAPL
ncbi:hypothetical protein BRADI_3g27977v3 [Brachypodium distachyon]|uniref:Uncharacterized protein n=1 Tax=Brachypodium distachyon TaxID=15368 RepID=A0A2K2CZP5_BRADI|nr:hypothetical protein BRADI_3g27977v3 [Brachypodium distachyon]